MPDRDGDGVDDVIDAYPDDPTRSTTGQKSGANPTPTASAGNGKTGGASSASGEPVTNPTQEGKYVIPWGMDPKTGLPISYATRADAYKYLKRTSPEYKNIVGAFSKYGGAITKTNTLATFWKKVVDASASTSSTPNDIISAYKAQYDADVAASKIPSTSRSTYFSYTTRDSANNDITKLLKDKYGITADAEQKQRYYNLIHAGEKQGASITTTTSVGGQTTSSTTQNQFDKEKLKQDTLQSIIDAYNKKTPGVKLQGEAGSIQDSLLSYANDKMGLSKGNREINVLVAKVIGGMNIQDAYKTIKEDAISAYGNFAKRLKEDTPGDLTQGLNIRTLANPYISMMANTLELDPNNIKLTDPTISNMISGDKLPSIADARKTFRQDKRWNNTQAAVEESKQLGYSMLRAFGYGV